MLGRQSGNGLIVMPDFFASAHRKQIISQANRHRVPAVYPYPFFSKDDGLISYGVDLADSFRSAGVYVGRILRGEKPAELQCKLRPSSNSSSISRLPRLLGWTYQCISSSSPTR